MTPGKELASKGFLGEMELDWASPVTMSWHCMGMHTYQAVMEEAVFGTRVKR